VRRETSKCYPSISILSIMLHHDIPYLNVPHSSSSRCYSICLCWKSKQYNSTSRSLSKRSRTKCSTFFTIIASWDFYDPLIRSNLKSDYSCRSCEIEGIKRLKGLSPLFVLSSRTSTPFRLLYEWHKFHAYMPREVPYVRPW